MLLTSTIEKIKNNTMIIFVKISVNWMKLYLSVIFCLGMGKQLVLDLGWEGVRIPSFFKIF